MFKKRKIEKRADINKDLEQIQEQQNGETKIEVPKSILSKKINKFSTKQEKNTHINNIQQKTKPIVKYGLIDKEEVNSKYHANLQHDQIKKPEYNSLVNLYVKKKMDELNKPNAKDKNMDSAVSEVINMQKKYLELQKQKLAEYDVTQIQKKLQNLANIAIRSQLSYRSNYLMDLLQNEHQRMQYASKKQIKTLRQQKQRLQKNFQSKYSDSGRRSYMEKIKHASLISK